MKQYSQHHLKVAASQPEHVVRKAEFDIAVTVLGERIESVEQRIDSRLNAPVVLKPAPEAERMRTVDHVASPSYKTVYESMAAADSVNGPCLPSVQAVLQAEEIQAFDRAESPQSHSVTETISVADSTAASLPDIELYECSAEQILLTDTAISPHISGDQTMEQSQMQGEIEVIVEDQNGTLKSRQKVSNAITDAFLRYTFYDMMNGGTLSSVLRCNIRSGYNLLSRTAPSTFGIYAMEHDINIRGDTFQPPYVTGDLNTLSSDVIFYNVDGNATEDSQVMIPVNGRCYVDHSRKELVVEYVKNTGEGIVKSVCVGRSHLLKPQMFAVVQNETAVSNQWTSMSTNYLIEHSANAGTSLWKAVSATAQYRFNLKSRTTETFNSSPLYTNFTTSNLVGGLVVGDHLFKAMKQGATGSSYTIRLHYAANFRTASTTSYKEIVLTTRDGKTVATDTIPVMVYRPDTDKLEIFVTLSLGDHGGENGCNVQKITVSGLGDPATMTTATVDLGLFSYCISNFGTNAAQYITGTFDGGTYYLPYTYTVESNGRTDNTAEATFQNGIMISEDFGTIDGIVNFRNMNTTPNLFVRADSALLQCQANLANIPYIFMSQVVSGANLPEASIKGLDDVLRIIYRYRLF